VAQKLLHNVYCSLNIREIISRKVRWAGHIARMKNMRNTQFSDRKKPLRRQRRGWDDLGDTGWEAADKIIWFRTESTARLCEHSSKPSSSSIRGDKFLVQLSDC